jgi:hypothetical protein
MRDASLLRGPWIRLLIAVAVLAIFRRSIIVCALREIACSFLTVLVAASVDLGHARLRDLPMLGLLSAARGFRATGRVLCRFRSSRRHDGFALFGDVRLQ